MTVVKFSMVTYDSANTVKLLVKGYLESDQKSDNCRIFETMST